MGKIIFCLLISLYSFMDQSFALEDGDFYKIVNPESGKVLTVGSSQATDGAEIILSPWKNEANQKWLAVQAVVAGDNYLLMPQMQRWDWNRFLRQGQNLRETRERHDSLPDWSLVLNGNSANGQVTVQPRDSKKYQQWRSEVISPTTSSKTVIIKNLLDNKCLQAPSGTSSSQRSQDVGTTPAPTTTPAPSVGFFRRVRNWFGGIFGGGSSSSSSTPTTSTPALATSSNSGGNASKTSLVNCDSSNLGQQWTLELQNIR